MKRSPFFLQPQFGDWNLNQMLPSNKCQYRKSKPFCHCQASSKMHSLTFGSNFLSSPVVITDNINLASSGKKKTQMDMKPHHTSSIYFSSSTFNTVFRNLSTSSHGTVQSTPEHSQIWLRCCQTWHCHLPCCQWRSLGVAVDWLPGCALSLTGLLVPPRWGFDDRNSSPSARPSHPAYPSVI